MPKKLGINNKAVEAKVRKDAVKQAKDEEIQKQKQDEFWRDDDKLINRKFDRQNEREKKRLELAQRKAQNKAAYENELNQLESKKGSVAKTKVTRSQIQSTIAKKLEEKEPPKKEQVHLDIEIEENINHLNIEGDEARNIDEAISILRFVFIHFI